MVPARPDALAVLFGAAVCLAASAVPAGPGPLAAGPDAIGPDAVGPVHGLSAPAGGSDAAIATPGARAGDGGIVRIPAPDGGWVLRLDLPGFELGPLRAAAGWPGRLLVGENRDTGMEISVAMEAMGEAVTAAACRETLARLTRRRSRVRRSAVRRPPAGETAALEYLLEGLQDGGFHQKHQNIYLARDGVCVDVHLSKERFNWTEADRFEAIVRSITVEAAPAPASPPPAGAAAPVPSTLRSFPIPGRDWSLVIDVFGLVMDGSSPVYEFEAAGRWFTGQRVTGRWWTGRRLSRGLALVVYAEESSRGGSAERCRDAYWPRIRLSLPVRLENVRSGERGGTAWVDYRKPWRQRARLEARARHVFLDRDGVCVTAALEKIDPRPEDDGLFEAFLDAARTMRRPAPAGPGEPGTEGPTRR